MLKGLCQILIQFFISEDRLRVKYMALIDIVIWFLMMLILLIAVITDLKKRIIPDRLIVVGFLTIGGLHLIFRPRELWVWVVVAAGAFVTLAIVAIISNGRIGGGDVKLFSLLGFGLGWEPLIWIFIVSHLIGGVVAVVLWLTRRVKKEDGIPFAPFILAGFLFVGGMAYMVTG